MDDTDLQLAAGACGLALAELEALWRDLAGLPRDMSQDEHDAFDAAVAAVTRRARESGLRVGAVMDALDQLHVQVAGPYRLRARAGRVAFEHQTADWPG